MRKEPFPPCRSPLVSAAGPQPTITSDYWSAAYWDSEHQLSTSANRNRLQSWRLLVAPTAQQLRETGPRGVPSLAGRASGTLSSGYQSNTVGRTRRPPTTIHAATERPATSLARTGCQRTKLSYLYTCLFTRKALEKQLIHVATGIYFTIYSLFLKGKLSSLP